jgi:hypothetical protein
LSQDRTSEISGVRSRIFAILQKALIPPSFGIE